MPVIIVIQGIGRNADILILSETWLSKAVSGKDIAIIGVLCLTLVPFVGVGP